MKLYLFILIIFFNELSADDDWLKTSLNGYDYNVNYVKCDNNGNLWANTGTYNNSKLYKSTDNGLSWFQQIIDSKIKQYNELNFCENRFYLSTDIGYYRSTDLGETWEHFNVRLGAPYSIFECDSNTLFTLSGHWSGYLIEKSTDLGKNWYHIESFDRDPFIDRTIRLEKYSNNEVVVVLCELLYNDTRNTCLLKKYNVTNDKIDTLAKWRYSGEFINNIWVDEINSDIFIPVRNKRSYFIWNAKEKILDTFRFPVEIEGINYMVQQHNGTFLVALSKKDNGVLLSNDSGKIWDHLKSGLEGAEVNYIVVSKAGTILAATNKGVFRSAKSFITGLDSISDIEKFVCKYDFRNHLIRTYFTLEKSSEIFIKFYNILGENIINISRFSDQGENEIILENIDLNSGIYFIQLETSNWKTSKKIIVIN